MSKPTQKAIRGAVALSQLPTRGADPILACNLCGEASASLGAWREHDERDRPIAGRDALVFIASDHKECRARMERHPRLYAEETGAPGTFPCLCGPCTHRSGFSCAHPRLKANGGPGLRVTLQGLGAGGTMILCGRGHGCSTPLKRAVRCVGREP